MSFHQIALGLSLVSLLSGCDALRSEPDTTLVLTGTVVLAETGAPLAGLGVTLRATGGFGSSVFIKAKTTTAANGTFRLTFEGAEEGTFYTYNLNDEPYDGRYTAYGEPVRAGNRIDYGVIELRRNAAP